MEIRIYSAKAKNSDEIVTGKSIMWISDKSTKDISHCFISKSGSDVRHALIQGLDGAYYDNFSLEWVEIDILTLQSMDKEVDVIEVKEN